MTRNLIFGFLFMISSANAATVNSTLYILRDSITFNTGVKFPYATFNSSNSFNQKNAQITTNVGDQWVVWVVNFDLVAHQFAIKDETSAVSILPGDSVQVTYNCNNYGAFVFYDPTNYPDYSSTGLSGLLVVKNSSNPHFYWNLKEHQTGYNSTIFAGGSGDWANYYPDYFTINENGNPEINLDPTARIVGNVGDTLDVCIANAGQSIHSIHFHGYHFEIRYSSKSPEHVGRSKDSVPIYPAETLILRLIPDKPGEYPVHDHNLIATSGGYMDHMGMMTTLLIAP